MPCRRYAEECKIPLPPDGLRKSFRNWKLNGRRFEKRLGYLPFDPGERVIQYTTMGGPCFHHPGVVVYGNSPANIALALNRLDAARPLEEQLVRNNLRILPGANRGLSRYLDSYYRKVRSELTPLTAQLGCELTEQIRSAVDPTHAKYVLRRECMRQLLERECMSRSLFMTDVTVKLKVPESAKSGKGTRAIGDFTCPGSLLAPFLVTPLKEAFATRIEHDDCIIRFVASTEASEIDQIVSEMYNSDRNYFIYFSDDMMCKIIRNGVPEYYNLDISSCDKSNTRAVFLRLKWFYADTDWHALIDRAIEQCRSPIFIRNPANPKEYITAETMDFTEFSGTILTTLLNNIAAAAICLSINFSLRNAPSSSATVDVVASSAFAVGYNVTAEACSGPEDLQFLKMSFWQDASTGELHSFLNLGAIMRSFGTCWMDYPYSRKRGEDLQGAIRFRNWAVLQGYQHAGSTEFYRSLLACPGAARTTVLTSEVITNHVSSENRYKPWLSTSLRPDVPTEAILRRYRMDKGEYTELCKMARAADVGHFIHCSAVYRILHKDYGYALPIRKR